MFTVLRRGFASYKLRTPIHHLNSPQKDVTLLCWVRSLRKHKDVQFMDLSDGLSAHHLQAVVNKKVLDVGDIPLSAGCSVKVTGDIVEVPGRNILELVVKQLDLVGESDAHTYPFQPRNKYSIDFERTVQHLRPRIAKYSAVHRVRNKMTQAIHNFFQELNFCEVQTPIITQNDCEGGGETFVVNHENDIKIRAKHLDPSTKQIKVDDPENQTYFSSQCHLTVSAQLHLEALMHSISRVYTLQPAFRAENALSRKHLCEFAMLEAELVIEDFADLLSLTEDLVKRSWKEVRQLEDFKVLGEEWRDTVDLALAEDFVRMSYDDALKELEGKKLECPVSWGDDFKVEHENILLEAAENRPVFITEFPASIKPFYMSTVEGKSGEVAQCFDLLMPVGGEVVGGSLRETSHKKLSESIAANGLKGLEWYLQLREFGTIPHGGFGLGMDRLLQYFTNTHSIKETVPFPRWQRHCQA